MGEERCFKREYDKRHKERGSGDKIRSGYVNKWRKVAKQDYENKRG